MTPKPTRRAILRSVAVAGASTLLRPLRGQILRDPLRPAFHYLPERGWMNDPCAPLYWQGQYHLFHQYNPHAAVWGDMHWFHATSPDLVHWTRNGVALAPQPGSADADGCFTGSAVLRDGTPAILYTGIRSVPHSQATLSDGTHNFRETQILATPVASDLSAWTPTTGNPVIPSPPPGMAVTGFRDPYPFQIPGRPGWFVIIGSGIRGVGGNVLLYSSPDLLTWTYLHPLAQGKATGLSANDPVDSGEMWECPDLFRLNIDGKAEGDTWVFIHSTERKTLWQTGRLDPITLRFHAERMGELDYGIDNVSAGTRGTGTFYAPKTQLDKDGRRILWGWIPETRSQAEYAAAGWSGMMSLPRALTLGPGGDLRQAPATALQVLRRPAVAQTIARNTQDSLQFAVNGPIHEVRAQLVSRKPQAAVQPPLTQVRDATGLLLELIVNPGQTPASLTINDRVVELHEPLSTNAAVHIFFDNSVAEVFIDGRVAFTHRFYARDPAKAVVTINLPNLHLAGPPQLSEFRPIWSS